LWFYLSGVRTFELETGQIWGSFAVLRPFIATGGRTPVNILTKPARNGAHIEMWYTGGKRRIIPAPTPPGFYSLYQRPDGYLDPHPLMSDSRKPVALWRVDCRTYYDVKRQADEEALEAQIPWVHMLTMLHGFAQKDEKIKVAAWDLEAIASSGQFPNAARDPIKNVGYVSDTREEVLDGDPEAVLRGFVDVVQRDDPDVLVTYNGGKFDWQYASAVARRLGVPFNLGRLNDPPYISVYTSQHGKFAGETVTVWLGGRTIMDAWKEVRMDTSLTGEVENRSLKTVSRYFQRERASENIIPADQDIIEVPYHKMAELSNQVLNDYVLSDARCTYHIARYYLQQLTALAVEFNAPLNLIVDRSPSHVGQLLFGSELKKAGIVSDGVNYERFKGVLWL